MVIEREKLNIAINLIAGDKRDILTNKDQKLALDRIIEVDYKADNIITEVYEEPTNEIFLNDVISEKPQIN